MHVRLRRGGPGWCLIAALTLLISLGAALPVGASPAARPLAQTPPVGAVLAVALDRAGNGWAWAASAPQAPGDSFVLRIADGMWTIAASSDDNPTLLPNNLLIHRMVLTAAGDEGWAIGSVDDETTTPILWHLQNGAWHVAKTSFAPTLGLVNVTMSADGSDGWMTALDSANSEYKLLRLRNHTWNFVPEPAHGALDVAAISPDGHSGWAVGPNDRSPQGNEGGFRLVNGSWVAAADTFAPLGEYGAQMTVDNAGNGWLITLPVHAGDSDSGLIRLTPNAPPRRLPALTHLPAPNDAAVLSLHAVQVDSLGHGWAVGSFDLGQDPSTLDPNELYQPVQLQLRGDTATVIPGEWVNETPDSQIDLLTLAISDGGAHTWIGDEDGPGFGHLAEMPQPWAHPNPIAAPLLPGAGRCFAEVPYCLRGVFADYWQAHGGLDQFGFPVTPELIEHQGKQTYTVQYTERARLEYHPENKAPFDVLLGLLGNTLADARQGEAPFQPKIASIRQDTQWFPATQHNSGPPFLAYWNTHGGVPVYGYPRSEAFNEKNAADGKVYNVQYFERNRIEYHPEHAGTKFEFLLGLLGVEQFRQTYGYTP